jgi:hypothetical protein
VDRGPTIGLRITGVIREGGYDITPIGECERLHVGDRLLGCYVAPADHSGHASLRVEPSSAIPSSAPVSDRAAPREDHRDRCGTWELDTANMRPRSYTLSLRICDRSRVEANRCYGLVSVDFRLSGRLQWGTRGDSGSH